MMISNKAFFSGESDEGSSPYYWNKRLDMNGTNTHNYVQLFFCKYS